MKSFPTPRLLVGSSLLVAAMALPVSTAQAAPITYVASLSGLKESPPNDSLGTGFAAVVFDSVAHTLQLDVSFSGLTGMTTAAHIHAATAVPGVGNAGVATQVPTFTGFPLGVTSGFYSSPVFDLTLTSNWNPTYITNNGGTPASAEAALFQAIFDGRAYLNIHTSYRGGGEIRGFLEPVPEPASLILLGTGLAGLGAKRLRRRR